MTVAAILNGPMIDRSNAEARARVPMTEANVRAYIRDLEAGNPNRNARKRMAELAIKHGATAGTIDAGGLALYRRYLATFG